MAAASTTSTQTRTRIVDAAAAVMRDLGLARATTKAIAAAAGYSEATLYKHFPSKEELFLAVLQERLPDLGGLLAALRDPDQDRSVAENLIEVAAQAVAFYTEGVPVAASIFAEPSLLAQHRERLAALGAGPQHVNAGLAGYLRVERDRGRLPAHLDPQAAADLLIGACFQHGFLLSYAGGTETDAQRREFATGIVTTLLGENPSP
ncbi:TetR/AcrR family transcriptional regulator [Natronosporangium hydrolyticum]|uniref:TetR/AcrR family transcriptional regulator n=1 Tax=Natronosporangium hydrolyticum TaxID=2811111 RepID=A0A895YF13_9ACTN|nr:TetR/AcrR family transcriptional regulator [Natronosporangium hydrolyticum]QSB13126.1 TetR/AcrR family transcriptional regulator [Natronosporangium hydrolyticum]